MKLDKRKKEKGISESQIKDNLMNINKSVKELKDKLMKKAKK